MRGRSGGLEITVACGNRRRLCAHLVRGDLTGPESWVWPRHGREKRSPKQWRGNDRCVWSTEEPRWSWLDAAGDEGGGAIGESEELREHVGRMRAGLGRSAGRGQRLAPQVETAQAGGLCCSLHAGQLLLFMDRKRYQSHGTKLVPTSRLPPSRLAGCVRESE